MIVTKRLLPKRRLPPKRAPALGRRRQEKDIVGINPPVDLLPGKRRKKRLNVLYRA